TFVDPSVEFGLRFETHDDEDDDSDDEDDGIEDDDGAPGDDGARPDAEVVSLDKWRK
ncbi:MAG: hypothetical protein H5U20_04635, partial [Rhodobacteraceae bacterium]|nr:hypothetical protein [Paracoccaceae bacterium]